MLARRASKFSIPSTTECDWVDQQNLIPDPGFDGPEIDPSWQVSPGGYTFVWTSEDGGAGKLSRNNGGYRVDMAYNNIVIPAACAAAGYLITCSWGINTIVGQGRVLIRDQDDNELYDSGNRSGFTTGSGDLNLNAGISLLKVQLSGSQATTAVVNYRWVILRPTIP